MDILLWIATGGVVGWLSHSLVGFNLERGRNVSILLGAVGALIGGKAIAPMFIAVPAGELGSSGLLFAVAAASLLLVLGNLVYRRWGV